MAFRKSNIIDLSNELTSDSSTPPPPPSTTRNSTLAKLVTKIQKNADDVEADVTRCAELMNVVEETDNMQLHFQHRDEVKDKLDRVEGLLKDLFLDVDKVKKLKHVEAEIIEKDIHYLHHHWMVNFDLHRTVYYQSNDVSQPLIDWERVFTWKQKQLNMAEYGLTMADVEKQIKAHKVLHEEIKFDGSQLCIETAGSEVKYSALKKQYDKILEISTSRQNHLSSLYKYMEDCKKRVAFLTEQQDRIKEQDWSDHLNLPEVHKEYENFKNNSALVLERQQIELEDEGDRLIALKHPASPTIEAQIEFIQNEWKRFLILCLCQEKHMDNVEKYKKYRKDTEQFSETLTELNSSLNAMFVSKRDKAATLLQLKAEEKAVQNSEQVLEELKRCSTTTSPLKLRRTTPNRPITVEAIQDWKEDKDTLSKGDKFSLKSKLVNGDWDVVSADGTSHIFPGVCFQIPPPDPEAIFKADLLGNELADIKMRRAALAKSLNNQPVAATSNLTSSTPNNKTKGKDKHFIDEHRNELIKRVSNIDLILDDLLEKEVIRQGIYDKIRAKTTTEEMMRDLYSGPLKAGKACKDILYKSLEKHEKYLMEDLKNE